MMSKKTVIGIVPSFDEGEHIPAGGGNIRRIYLRNEYAQMLANVGAVPLVLNPDMLLEDIVDMCDGIVISGGEDLDPKTYQQEPIAQPVKRYFEPAARFAWEKKLIKACDEAELPILGICYGMQCLNVYYGGSLLQDIATELPDNVGHDNTEHTVTLHGDFLGMSGVQTVASRHHQAVGRLADGFRVVAEAPDGVIEAIEGHGHFGMQWHPESDETGARVYRAFVEYCQQ